MIDREHHTAQELATEATLAYKQGQYSNAAGLYRRAAEHEARAFANVPDDKPRTRGIIGVSLAALYYKAGRYDDASEVATSLLASSNVPEDLRIQLEEIIGAIKHALQEHA